MANRYERDYGYEYHRLPKETQDKVLQTWRYTQVDYQWWDYMYKDATHMGALMGIEVEDIQFTGFCSQGDGASFIGRYAYQANCVEAITSECGGQDKELIRIAEELTKLQVTWQLLHGFTWECTIQLLFGHHCHSNMMQTGYEDDDDRYAGDDAIQMDLSVQQLLRDFADWIYHRLEAEYDHLTSDEVVIQSIESSGLRFNSSGATI